LKIFKVPSYSTIYSHEYLHIANEETTDEGLAKAFIVEGCFEEISISGIGETG